MPGKVCQGGPLDGLDADPDEWAFAWIDGRGECHVTPGRGRVLYRNREYDWGYVGPGFRQCGCGVILEPSPGGVALDQCPLCADAPLPHLPDGEAAR